MVQFVKPNLLGKYQEYMNRFVNPITNGQYTDSTAFDIQVMKRRSHVLHKLLNGCVQVFCFCSINRTLFINCFSDCSAGTIMYWLHFCLQNMNMLFP